MPWTIAVDDLEVGGNTGTPSPLDGPSLTGTGAFDFYVTAIASGNNTGVASVLGPVNSPWTLDQVFNGSSYFGDKAGQNGAAAYLLGTGVQQAAFDVTGESPCGLATAGVALKSASPISIVNETVYPNVGELYTDTFTIPETTAGNALLVVLVFIDQIAANISLLTDSSGDTFVERNNIANDFPWSGSGAGTVDFWLANPIAGGAITISFESASSYSPIIYVYELGPSAQPPGNIVVTKATKPSGSPQSFTFTLSYGSPFSLTDGESNDSGPLVAGVYSVAETPVDGWTTTVNSDPLNIVVTPGNTTPVLFTNSKNSQVQPPCAPLTVIGKPVNGVFVADLGLFIIPATALYDNLIPNSQLSLSETANQGRREIIVDFNGSEGMWKRDLGTIFTWPMTTRTALYVWQPSIIPFPMGDDIYYRLSFHALMSSLGITGWGHVREFNVAHQSTADLTLLLTFDTGPAISLTVPNSAGQYAKNKITVPANKFKMVEVLVSSTAPFKLYGSDLEMKIKQWGSTESYHVAKPVVD